MFELPPVVIGTTARSGPAQWLAEAVATFTLILTILGGVRFLPQATPWLVGLVITAAYWFTASTSFANPAVTLARGFTTTFEDLRFIFHRLSREPVRPRSLADFAAEANQHVRKVHKLADLHDGSHLLPGAFRGWF